MAKLTIDPITRIEGHLRIDVEIENGKVKDAWSSAQLFRGLEIILKGRDPRDAPHITQRACGVCTEVHALASIRALDDAAGVKIPDLARLTRNLLHGVQFIHDHITHFYVLHALDWVDVVNALQADPKKTAALADSLGNYPNSGVNDFRDVKARLQKFVDSGQLGPFANGYWGHPDYRLPAEANLLAAAHYIEWLRMQTRAARMMAMLGGKNPHVQVHVTGGVSCVQDVMDVERLSEFLWYLQAMRRFIDNVYLPDLLAVASFYKDWGGIGGTTNFLAYGNFPQKSGPYGQEDMWLPGGVIFDRDIAKPQPVDPARITEEVKRAWYADGEPRHPYQGVTEPILPDYDYEGKYSFFKAPRYEGRPMEVGPLAQMLMAYAGGVAPVKASVEAVLKHLDIPVTALFSTLGRTAARAIQTKVITDEMELWVNQIVERLRVGDTETVARWQWPGEAMGMGLIDVPRGALGHWVKQNAQNRIDNYQLVVPSTWNLGPRDAKGQLGPVEESLVGTPVADPKRPVEILRTVHSFDPCIACGVHVIDPHTNEVYKFKVL
ncbi:nickel-dependent hydrogenase large subunit [Desulfarculus baarsii DSM 2075]|uniref:Nickel-dependent hydrogenase large subunit n=1 Tax=Desulfarculus baarsii (strain ATCC 33931 / DSM 2075 / LMG 7858 / VKM B-1802 / 2st14) TaxID=644282 RepID=E1QGS6_DESB2|nr:nickel-dependent hydrogenase large subunit [Desulfarculus baarsii]ADK84769.1 nickel-dependent hydrogenase large subunit [Desulfarculus baarsii DSM 2075]